METQDDFISILRVPVEKIDNLFHIIRASRLPGNLFLKHLIVLADFGGEILQRVNDRFSSLFPNRQLDYHWRWTDRAQTYSFQVLPIAGKLTNERMGVSAKRLLTPQPLSRLHEDVIALLLAGGLSVDTNTARDLAKCQIGDYLGKLDELEKFVRQRYLWVSRITGGSQSNTLGQLAQGFVQKYIAQHVGISGVEYRMNGHIPGVRHTSAGDDRETTFDLVLAKDGKYIAIEISFQVTTNSVIERKAGQAQARQQQIHAQGHRIAYVLDGAGNFTRRSAIRTLCDFSDCTVTFSQAELDVLCRFIRETFEESPE